MASVTDTGAVATQLATFRDRINAIWRSVYGEDLDTDTQTAPGQFAGLFAQALTEVSEAIVRVANMLNLDSAKKGQLDNLVSLLLIEREEGTNSVATVTFTGTPAVVIPAGTVVRSDQGDSFATGTAATIGAAPLGQTEGTVDAQVTAIATGPVPVDAGTIIRLAEGIAGVTAVTNTNAGAVGSAGETDTALSRRYRDSLSRFAQGHLDAIRSAFVRQASVDRVAVADNATDATAAVQGLDITAHTTAGVLIWADGVTGSQTLFDAIMDTVHAPGLPRQYEVSSALDTAIQVAAVGISAPAVMAAQEAIRTHVATLNPGDVITNPDLLFRAKLAVTLLGENPEGVTGITITPPAGRDVTVKHSTMNATGVQLDEHNEATVT